MQLLILSRQACFDHFSLEPTSKGTFLAFRLTLYPTTQACALNSSRERIGLYVTYGNMTRIFWSYYRLNQSQLYIDLDCSITIPSDQRECNTQLKTSFDSAFVYIDAVDETIYEPEDWKQWTVVFAVVVSLFSVGIVGIAVAAFVICAKKRKPLVLDLDSSADGL
ncbi:Hypothetical_protein [Hexamita inflata]|uniref:Hypothetical_protein n=1 Tax=Hexamita inflata TaxID=28002 RepID=A0ABP1HCD7_9EUKA